MIKVVFYNKVHTPGTAEKVKADCAELALEFDNPFYQEDWDSSLSSETYVEIYKNEIWYYVVRNNIIQSYTLFKYDMIQRKTFKYPVGKEGTFIEILPLNSLYDLNINVDKTNRKFVSGIDCYNVKISFDNSNEVNNVIMTTNISLFVTDELGIPGNQIINISNENVEYFPIEINKHIQFGDEEMFVNSYITKLEFD